MRTKQLWNQEEKQFEESVAAIKEVRCQEEDLKHLAAKDAATKKKRITIISILMAILTIAAVIIVTKVIIPDSKYKNAIALQQAGRYEEAIAAFEAMGKYSDAETQIKETRYLQAASLANSGDYTAAYAIYAKLSGYKNVDSLIKNDDNLAVIREARQKPYKTVGNSVTFGAYSQDGEGTDKTPIEWIVLDHDEENNKALLLSRYGLDAKPYNKAYIDITWEKCSLRTWLNGEFLNNAFSSEEQSAILLTAIDNSSTQGYNKLKVNGGSDIQDQIFLLSYSEANKYLDFTPYDSNNLKSRAAPTDYAIARGAYTSDCDYTEEGKAAGCWWLLSFECDQNDAYYVNSDGSLHYGIVFEGEKIVRPAFWLNLESALF